MGKNPREHICYPILKNVAVDLLRDCETAIESQKYGLELEKVFSVALVDVALEKWYGEE